MQLSESIPTACMLHPILAVKLMKTAKEIMAMPDFPPLLRPRITDGIRSDKSQEEKFALGLSNAAPGMSFHKYGLAGHISYFNTTTQKYDWERYGLFQKAQTIGAANGLKTGIVFKNAKGHLVHDWLHFELFVAPIREVKAKFEELGDWHKFNCWVTEKYLTGDELCIA